MTKCVVNNSTPHRGELLFTPEPYCARHLPDVLRTEVGQLDTRAAGVLMHYGWPYGPNVDVVARRALLAWTETHNLRLSLGNCLTWLRKGRCVGDCPQHHDGHRSSWQDHVTGWTRDRRPAVLVAHPYGLFGDGLADLARLTDDPALHPRVDGTGWYGHGTTIVEVWRADALFADEIGAAS